MYFSWQKHHIYFIETTTEKETNLNLWKAASGCPSIPSPSPPPGHLFGKTVQHIHLKCQRCQCASRTCPRGSVTKPPRVSRSIFVSQVIWIFIGSPVDWILICSLLYSVVLYLLACILSRSSSAHPLTEFWQNYTSMFYTIEYYRTYSFVFLFTEYQLFLGSPVEVKL